MTKSASFSYKAYNAEGRLVSGKLSASSKELAFGLLWNQDLTPVEVQGDQSPIEQTTWWTRDITIFSSIPKRDVANFTRDMATLLKSELTVDEALRLAAAETTNKKIRATVTTVLNDVIEGRAVSQAFRLHPQLYLADLCALLGLTTV